GENIHFSPLSIVRWKRLLNEEAIRMKKFYIIFVILLIIGIGSGIYYLEVVRPGSAELPEDIVMDTAFDGEYAFGEMDPKVRIIEFMYVNCPDICPVTTLEMSKL